MSAFEQYLLSLPLPEAVTHVVDCLYNDGTQAWTLMDEQLGSGWRCTPTELPQTIAEAITRLRGGV